jgi:hypothetical protein
MQHDAVHEGAESNASGRLPSSRPGNIRAARLAVHVLSAFKGVTPSRRAAGELAAEGRARRVLEWPSAQAGAGRWRRAEEPTRAVEDTRSGGRA